MSLAEKVERVFGTREVTRTERKERAQGQHNEWAAAGLQTSSVAPVKSADVGGIVSKPEIGNDFLIVACATAHSMDIVVSSGKNSMFSEPALRAYDIIKAVEKKGTPRLITYESFKWLLLE